MINLKFNIKRRNNSYDMPIIKLKQNGISIDCLLDTGARIPVWCAGESEFKVVFPESKPLNAVFLLSGFGTGNESARVYMIPDFVLTDGKEKIHYKNLLIAVMKKDVSVSLILSYTMFNKMNLSIDTYTNRNGTHQVEPNLKVSAMKQDYYVRPKSIDFTGLNKNKILATYKTENMLDSIYVFTQ